MNRVEPAFALIDCNSFYASCERVFRPDQARRPIVVLSKNEEDSVNLPSKWEHCAWLTSWKFKGKYYRSISPGR